MVEFGGWEMPMQYSGGIVQEHLEEEGYPKKWRVLKRMTERRKEVRQERGY